MEDPFEEEFDVPTLAVEFRDGEGLVSHVVGQESVDLSVGKVLIGNQPEFFRITPGGLVGRQFDDFIGHDSGVLVDWAGIEDVVFDVVLGPRNEEGAVPMNAVKQVEWETAVRLASISLRLPLFAYCARHITRNWS